MNLLELFEDAIKRKIKLYDNIYLEEGESAHIYGEPYCGKTTLCFNIIKNNPHKKIAYVQSEKLEQRYLQKLYTLSKYVYLVDLNCSRTLSLPQILQLIPIDVIIVDSITALYAADDNDMIAQLLNTITTKNIFAVYVSQMREFNKKEFYEHQKTLNYFARRIKVEKVNDYMILNKKHKIKFDSIWN